MIDELATAPNGLLFFQMKHALLGVDVHAEVAEKIQPQQAGDLGVGHNVVDCGGEVLEFPCRRP